MDDDTEQQIGFQGGDDDEMPPEMKDHMLAAFAHKAGLGPHPGMYKGEASAKKMKAARTGGSPVALGPSEFAQKQVQQRGALEQQATTQGAAQAAQATAQQTSVTPPPAPVGPEGTTVSYSAQKGATGPQKPPPSAPGPEEEEPENA